MSTKEHKRTTRNEFVAQNRKFLEDREKAGLKTLITYVRDEWGFKKGVVVALGPTQIGWSLVHQDKDSFRARVKPSALPVIQTLQREIAEGKLIIDNEVDYALINIVQENIIKDQEVVIDLLTKFATGSADIRPAVVKQYRWDREKGLHDAFRRALGGKFGDFTKEFIVAETVGTDEKITKRVPDVSVDPDVIATLDRVNPKLEKFFSTAPKQ